MGKPTITDLPLRRRRVVPPRPSEDHRITALCDLWRAAAHTEPARLLPMITERAAHVLGAHAASLLLRDPNGDTLRMAASVGLAQEIDHSVTLLVGERIAGRVAATGQAIHLNRDPRNHPLLAEGQKDISPRPEIESALCAPLTSGSGAILGVLCLSRYRPAKPFREEDLQVMTLFASQAGALIAHERLSGELEQRRQDVATLEHMAASVAHELRNPLSSIKGAAQFLLREWADSDRENLTLHDFLTIVVEEVDGLDRLANDLLEWARPPQSRCERRDLATLIQGQISLLRPELSRLGVSARMDDASVEPPVWVDVDAAQIGRALRNLLLNAAQAAHLSAEHPLVIVSLAAENIGDRKCYSVHVEDNGAGVPDTLKARLWEPFFTTKTRGVGLGLSQVRQVAQAHGGEIGVGDAPSGGARFTFTIPAGENEV